MGAVSKTQELVVISGKGGTGKTSVVASFAALAQNRVVVDCDVDAADLHLILDPQVQRREDFSGGKTAEVSPEKCTACGKCLEVCRFEAVSADGPARDGVPHTYRIDPIACEGCGVCAYFCPEHAIRLEPCVNGEWFVSETRHGPLVHARLGIAEENSGKLVSVLRREAKEIAKARNLPLIIVDGSPGLGCPVIASITGASLVLIVTEPTLSGLHDLDRVADLAAHFAIPAVLAINKSDLNMKLTCQISAHAVARGLRVLGSVRYDREVTQAQIAGLSVVEHGAGPAAQDITRLWTAVRQELSTN